MSTTLTISHNLFLTREERYSWQAGEKIEVVGVSIPVWYYKGTSSEPAIEVFCKYKLNTTPDSILVKQTDDGYEITVPQIPPKEFKPLPNDVWQVMNNEEKEQWYEVNEPEPSLKMLLDIKDGGAEYLSFRQYSKIHKGKKVLNIVHFVEIQDVKELLQTLT